MYSDLWGEVSVYEANTAGITHTQDTSLPLLSHLLLFLLQTPNYVLRAVGNAPSTCLWEYAQLNPDRRNTKDYCLPTKRWPQNTFGIDLTSLKATKRKRN